jgi:hypothetical protein
MFAELDDRLGAVEWSLQGGQQDDLQHALIDLIDTGAAWRALERILQDGHIASMVSAKCSIHENGFFRITLASTPMYGLRLHVWDRRPGGLDSRTESIHSHTVDLASAILVGGYRHDIFQDAESGQPFVNYEFRAPRDAQMFSLVAAGTSNVVLASSAHLPTGTTFTLDGGVLHTVTPNRHRLTASLALKGPQYRSFSRVLTNEAIATGPSVPVRVMPPGALERYVAEVLALKTTGIATAYER